MTNYSLFADTEGHVLQHLGFGLRTRGLNDITIPYMGPQAKTP